MYKMCQTEQSAARQRELEQGLLEIMGEKKFEEISISDLCEKLQIPRKSFYRYFSSKEGALHGLIDHTLMEYEGFICESETFGERSAETDLMSYFRFWESRKNFLDAMQDNGLYSMLMERSIAMARSDGGMPRRFLANHEQSTWGFVTMFGVCGLMSLVLTWHAEGFRISCGQMAKIAARLMTKPLFTDVNNR